MSLSTGDILAIVFGSILGLLIIGYLIYILLFRKKSTINVSQIKQHLTDNPSIRQEVSNHLEKLETKDTEDKVLNDEVLNEVVGTTMSSPGSYIMTTPVR